MISRVADAIYWMSRYLERAENVARFIDVNLHLTLDFRIEATDRQWEPLVVTSGDNNDFATRYGCPSEENVIRFLTFDEDNPNSIFSCVRAARENARLIRDTITSEMWEQINCFYLLLKKNSRKRRLDDLHNFFYKVKMANHLFVGLADTTMSHGEGWHFARMGRVLERADKTARIMDVKYFILLPKMEYVDSPFDVIQWGALLKSTSAFEMYRKKYHTVNYHDVADFLIYDAEFPRSLIYCLVMAISSIQAIIGHTKTESHALLELEQLHKQLQRTNASEILYRGLHEFIDSFQYNLNIVDKEIYNSFIRIT